MFIQNDDVVTVILILTFLLVFSHSIIIIIYDKLRNYERKNLLNQSIYYLYSQHMGQKIISLAK